MAGKPDADICLILEGTYPYVAGGVSSWVHDLLKAHSHLTFHLLCLLPNRAEREMRYEPPANVVGMSHVYLQHLPGGRRHFSGAGKLFQRLHRPIQRVLRNGHAADLQELLEILRPHRSILGRHILLNSAAAWEAVQALYEAEMPEGSFLDFFWSWRSMLSSLFAVLLSPLPRARVYHTISTGYAGMLAARAHIETGRPCIVTEHGIYTNERRIEITMANWLHDVSGFGLTLQRPKRDLKDLWIDSFLTYSHCTYETAFKIVTLYGGNQDMQRRDGAREEKLKIIPNGIDYARFSALPRVDVLEDGSPRPPTIALIGRVVPIKDVKTYIRAAGLLAAAIPNLQALILGPTEEDAAYFAECKSMVTHLGLQNVVQFLGRVRLDDWLGRIDVVVLTSISEAQPLVILEAGAAGVPTVATDVGACQEMILGPPGEDPYLGSGGAITPLANPMATARAIEELLRQPERLRDCCRAIRERVRTCYNKADLDQIYADLYAEAMAMPDQIRLDPSPQKVA